MDLVTSLTVCGGVYVFGVIVSKLTNGRVGSALVCIPVLFALFWTGLLTPADIDASQLPALFKILNAIILVNIGTTFDPKMIAKEKKIAVVCLSSLAVMGLVVLTIGRALFGRDLTFVAFPSLAGGTIATMLMQNAALNKGLTTIAAQVVLIMTVQGWISNPVISNTVRAESLRLLNERRAKMGKDALTEKPADSTLAKEAEKNLAAPAKTAWIDTIKIDNPVFPFFMNCFWAMISWRISDITAPLTSNVVGPALVGIFVGLIARQLGLIQRDPMNKAGIMPVFMFALIITMDQKLASLTPMGLLQSIPPILGLVAMAAVSLLITSILVGKVMGYSRPMSMCMGIMAFSGYPGNYQISREVFEAVTDNPEERQFLMDNVMPRVVISGVISVSVTSVIIGGIFANLL